MSQFRREISCPCLARSMLIVQETQILVNDHDVSLGYRLYKIETFLSKSEMCDIIEQQS